MESYTLVNIENLGTGKFLDSDAPGSVYGHKRNGG